MFSNLFGLTPPLSKSGQLIFRVVNEYRGSKGHSQKQHLPSHLAGNYRFIATLIALMDSVGPTLGEALDLKMNTEDLVDHLFDKDSACQAYKFTRRGNDMPEFLDAIFNDGVMLLEAGSSGDESIASRLLAPYS